MPNWIDIVLRHSAGNPNHKGSGPGGGQFASGPGGGSAAGKPHGKHWAKRQRRKAKLKGKQKQVVAKHAGERKAKRQQHLTSLKSAKSPKERASLREKYKGERQKTAKTHAAEREEVSTATRASTHSPTEKAKLDRLKKGKPEDYASEKAKRAAENQTLTDGPVQRYTKANEADFARRLGHDAKAFPDNGPVDVEITIAGRKRGLELKTLVTGKNDKITMASKPKKGETESAIDRKIAWQKANKNTTVDTFVLDHRNVAKEMDTGEFIGNKDLFSGHEVYYKRGTGSFRINAMEKVRDEAHALELLARPYAKLPKKAQGNQRGGVT